MPVRYFFNDLKRFQYSFMKKVIRILITNNIHSLGIVTLNLGLVFIK